MLLLQLLLLTFVPIFLGFGTMCNLIDQAFTWVDRLEPSTSKNQKARKIAGALQDAMG